MNPREGFVCPCSSDRLLRRGLGRRGGLPSLTRSPPSVPLIASFPSWHAYS